MFIFTTKLDRKKMILIFLAVALLISAVILMSPTRLLSTGGQSDQAMAEQAGKKAGSDAERVAFLKSFGWKIEEKPVEMCEVQIPKVFDEVYKTYNEIQKAQGYDLLKYKGKTATMYTYKVLNYPTGEKEARANLLVYKDKVIGGDICSLNLDGFMHGFAMPKAQSASTSKTEAVPATQGGTQTSQQKGTATTTGTATKESTAKGTAVKGLFKEE